MNSNDIPDRERTRAILLNWMFWSRSLPPDPAQVYYYTVSPMFNDDYIRSVQDKANEEKDEIDGLWKADALFTNQPPSPVRLMTPEEYANAIR